MTRVKTRNMIRREEAEWLNPETNPECVVYEERQETGIETTKSDENEPLYIMEGETDDAIFPVNNVEIKEELSSSTYASLPSTSVEHMEIDSNYNEESAQLADYTTFSQPESPCTYIQIVSCRSVANRESPDAHQNEQSQGSENSGSEAENSNCRATTELLQNSGFESENEELDTISEIRKLQTLFSDRSRENGTILRMLSTLQTQLEMERKETAKLKLENANLRIRIAERDVQVGSAIEMTEIIRSEINQLKHMLQEKAGRLSAEGQKCIKTTDTSLDKINVLIRNSSNTKSHPRTISVITWAPKTVPASTVPQKQELQAGADNRQQDGSVIKRCRTSPAIIKCGYLETKTAAALKQYSSGEPLLIDSSSDEEQQDEPSQGSSQLASIENHHTAFNPDKVNAPKQLTRQVVANVNAQKSRKSSPGPVKRKKHSRKGTRKYACSICSHAFKHEDMLLAHIRIHSVDTQR